MTFLLHHRVIEGTAAQKTAFVLHGALGSGQNFSRFVQKLAARRPDYRYVLVDLRNHGQSSGAPPPHTLSSCAGDLRQLERHLEQRADVLIGHSFGGKVAIEFARQGSDALAQVWVLDAVPGSQGEGTDSEVSAVIAAVRGVPVPAHSRADVVSHLVERAGLSSGMAQWMATNLRRADGHYVWSFDLDGIEALMRDYFRVDLWGFLARARQAPAFELVVAERSDRWTPTMRAQAAALPPDVRVTVHELPNSGHWVHVDNPAGLQTLLGDLLI
jgi:pimeloyl-ACP methyl ester carboxylesterase